MKPTLASALENTKSVLILLPKNPYFDQVAAACGLFLAIKDKYETTMHSPTPMLVEFNRLVGVDRVSNELANKNVIIKLINYPASQIERVLYDTDGVNELALTVIAKQGVPSPKPENFTFTQSGITVDTVILLGGANDTHFPALALPDLANVKIVHIGRESVNLNGREVMSLARPASSLSEVVCSVLNESSIEISADAGTNLFAGVIEGSRNFTDAAVTADTFKIASHLLEHGARRMQTQQQPRPVPGQGSQPQGTGSAAPQQGQNPPQGTGGASAAAPKSWLEPKIFKGTSVS